MTNSMTFKKCGSFITFNDCFSIQSFSLIDSGNFTVTYTTKGANEFLKKELIN